MSVEYICLITYVVFGVLLIFWISYMLFKEIKLTRKARAWEKKPKGITIKDKEKNTIYYKVYKDNRNYSEIFVSNINYKDHYKFEIDNKGNWCFTEYSEDGGIKETRDNAEDNKKEELKPEHKLPLSCYAYYHMLKNIL